jgi:hypothetical protein
LLCIMYTSGTTGMPKVNKYGSWLKIKIMTIPCSFNFFFFFFFQKNK